MIQIDVMLLALDYNTCTMRISENKEREPKRIFNALGPVSHISLFIYEPLIIPNITILISNVYILK